jgi:hypothetical protein
MTDSQKGIVSRAKPQVDNAPSYGQGDFGHFVHQSGAEVKRPLEKTLTA